MPSGIASLMLVRATGYHRACQHRSFLMGIAGLCLLADDALCSLAMGYLIDVELWLFGSLEPPRFFCSAWDKDGSSWCWASAGGDDGAWILVGLVFVRGHSWLCRATLVLALCDCFSYGVPSLMVVCSILFVLTLVFADARVVWSAPCSAVCLSISFPCLPSFAFG